MTVCSLSIIVIDKKVLGEGHAPILARLHFLTINVFGSCQRRAPDKEYGETKHGTKLRPSNFRPKNGTASLQQQLCREKIGHEQGFSH